ncbi:hypothetical protein H6P81_015861 [Aristolochia fimbriata]|uniref:Uncharacterized protein n=1 Tax=Aristolochia fimbriata TaxID=158543 RepID=A0AAV7E9M1_ARIFI|nr:hypothetical protein H6P81_015861 [Aristolochia fimbriata]
MASNPSVLVPLLLLLLHVCSFTTARLNTHLTKDMVKELVADRRTANANLTELGYITFDIERRYAMETYTMIKNFP